MSGKKKAGDTRSLDNPPQDGVSAPGNPSISMVMEDDGAIVAEQSTVASLQRKLEEMGRQMEQLQQLLSAKAAPTAAEGGIHVDLSSRPETSPPPPKRRAEASPIDADAPIAVAVPSISPSHLKWEPKTEWYGLMAPSTPAARNREILNAVENEALYHKVPTEMLHERVMRISADSPDAANYATASCDGYALIKLLRGALESEVAAKPIVIRHDDMTADAYFEAVTESLTKEERKLDWRKETLKQIALRDRTLKEDKLRELLTKIALEDINTLTSQNAHLLTQLKRLWMSAKVFMGAKSNQHSEEETNSSRKRKHPSNAPSSSSSSSSPKPSSSHSTKKPSRPCKYCAAAGVTGDKAMHYDDKCTNAEAKKKYPKNAGKE